MSVCLHVHWESRFDAVPHIKDMFSRLKEIGATTVAVTDHGSLCAIQDIYDNQPMTEINGEKVPEIKIIYGVEGYLAIDAYSQNDATAHIIIMAKDSIGKRNIDKLMYEANKNINSKGFPVITYPMLEKYFGKNSSGYGHAVFTTACISGPSALLLLENSRAEKKIVEKKNQMDMAINDGIAIKEDNEELKSLKVKKSDVNAKIENIKEKIKEYNAIVKKPTLALEKKLKRYEEINEEERYQETKIILDDITKEKEIASKELPILKTELEALTRRQKSIKEKESVLGKKLAITMKYLNDIEKQKRHLKNEDECIASAKAELLKMVDILGKENLYIELQYHGLSDEKYVYPKLAKFAKEENIKMCVANDAHMARNTEYDLINRSVAKFLRYGTIMKSTEEEINAEKEMYLKSNSEIKESLIKILPEDIVDEAIRNTDEMENLFTYKPQFDTHYPVFDKTIDSKTLLRKIAKENISWRYPKKGDWTEEHQKRLDYESDTICNMGYADYHLIMKEVLEYGRIVGKVPSDRIKETPLDIEAAKKWVEENGWNVGTGIGPARGSAAGSLVCYLLGITSIDPMKYDLLFERFLNPERYSMPDIDSDFKPDIRDKVIDFCIAKYGQSAVCNILTKSKQNVKGAMRDAGRYLDAYYETNIYSKTSEAMRKTVPVYVGITFDTKMSDIDGRSSEEDETVYEYLYGIHNKKKDENGNIIDNEIAVKILKIAKAIEGSFYGYGVHAAGVVISDNSNLTDYIPLQYNTKKECWVTCCDKEQVEGACGLLKMDFLNLQTLYIITEACMKIKENHGVEIDALSLPFEKEVFSEIFAKGRTIGVFQFESYGMRKSLKDMKPDCIEDLIILNAMFRPGPIKNIDKLCAAKNGKQKISYMTPQLEPILKDTYGYIVYQEQVMLICQKLAGYTLGQADMVRKYMSKKKSDKLIKERPDFVYGNPDRNIKGCVANGIDENIANALFDDMIDFGKYAFNKSHAAAYTVLAYATGWLKYHYPAEFFCALLNSTNKIEKYTPIIEDAKAFNIDVLPPDINHSQTGFSVYNGKIIYGLSAIKGIGPDICNEIIKKRKEGAFKSFNDFMLRGHKGSGIDKALISVGAFDSLNYTRKSLSGVVYDDMEKKVKKIKEKNAIIKNGPEVIKILKECDFQKEEITLDDLKEKLAEKGISFTINGKKVPTEDSILKRINNAKTFIEEATEEIQNMSIPYIKDSFKENLSNEIEKLGFYLTGHPIDEYQVTTNPIESIEANKFVEITGAVLSKTVRFNKNKKEWATIQLGDKTGAINVNIFNKEYEKIKDYLEIGNVVIVSGNVEIDDFRSTEEEIVFCLNAKGVKSADKSEECYMLEVENIGDLYFNQLKNIRKCKTEKNGVHLVIYLKTESLFREVSYSVSKQDIKLLGAKRVNY